MNKDRRSTVKKSVFAVIILALLIALIGGTYARYVSSATGSGDVNIAKWAVKVNDQDFSDTLGTFDLTFKANNADTVANKVAPGGTAIAYVDVDLTGTEVSVDLACALDGRGSADNLTAIFGENYDDKVTVSIGIPTLQGTTSNMTLDETNKVITVGTDAMSGTVRVPITLTWKDDPANNTADTITGSLQTGVSIPVTLSVTQHISAN